MPFRDERQVRGAVPSTYGSAIENGPPDTETLDRRRVDPPAGCRVATEPAIVLKRRSVNDNPSLTPAIHLQGWSVRRFSGFSRFSRRRRRPGTWIPVDVDQAEPSRSEGSGGGSRGTFVCRPSLAAVSPASFRLVGTTGSLASSAPRPPGARWCLDGSAWLERPG